MARNALLLHGTSSSPEDNWFPWLKNRLAWRGFDVAAPQLPQADEPNMERYWEVLRGYPYDRDTVIVGHSSGGVAALGVLDRLPESLTINKVMLIGAFAHDEGWNCDGLFQPPLNYKRLRQRAKSIELWWSPSDKYVSKEQTDELAKSLGVHAEVFPDEYGHFNTEVSARFREFPELVEAILS